MVKGNIVTVIIPDKLHNLCPTAHDIQFHKVRIVAMRFQFRKYLIHIGFCRFFHELLVFPACPRITVTQIILNYFCRKFLCLSI